MARARVGGGELGAGIEDAGDDHGDDQIALAALLGGDDPLQPQPPQRAQHGGDVAVGQASEHLNLLEVFDLLHRLGPGVALEGPAHGLDGVLGQVGDVGDGLLADPAALEKASSHEDGGA